MIKICSTLINFLYVNGYIMKNQFKKSYILSHMNILNDQSVRALTKCSKASQITWKLQSYVKVIFFKRRKEIIIFINHIRNHKLNGWFLMFGSALSFSTMWNHNLFNSYDDSRISAIQNMLNYDYSLKRWRIRQRTYDQKTTWKIMGINFNL